MFVIVTRRPAFRSQWEGVFARRGAPIIALESLPLLEGCIKRGGVRLVVLDFSLPGTADPALVRRLLQLGTGTRVVAAGVPFAPQAELGALGAGVMAACDQALTPEELTRIIDVVMQGGIWISRAGIPLLVGKLQGLPSAPPEQGGDAGLARLSPREREVAELVGRGANNKAIADALAISDRTVKAHLTTIFEKLGVPDRLQLALYVTGRGHRAAVPAANQPQGAASA